MIFKKAPFGRPFRPRWHQKWTAPNGGGHPFRDPAFHETTVIPVPLGPSFLKTSFFRWWLATFPFFLLFVVLCFICHFYHICWKSLGKRPAVEPSDFWENHTRFQKQRFFLFCFFTFAFFILFHIFVDFRLPLPPPLAQINLICGRFWSHFSKTFHLLIHKVSLGSAAVPVRALQYTLIKTCIRSSVCYESYKRYSKE